MRIHPYENVCDTIQHAPKRTDYGAKFVSLLEHLRDFCHDYLPAGLAQPRAKHGGNRLGIPFLLNLFRLGFPP